MPAAALVRASRRFSSALISVDLPTFDRPTIARWGASYGTPRASAALVMNSALDYVHAVRPLRTNA